MEKRMKHLISLLIIIALSCSPAFSRSFRAIEKDALTVGMLTSTAPFGKMKQSTLKGVEYELAAAVATKLGVRFRIIEISNLREGKKKLKKDRIDLLISTVKENKKDGIIYTAPYYKTGLGIMTKKKDNRVFSAIDLNGKYVAAVAASTGNTFLKKFIKKAKVELVTKMSETYDLLANNEVDAIIADKVILDYEATVNPRVKTLDLTLTEEEYVMGVNKKFPKLLSKINKAVKSVVYGSGSGASKFDEILTKYGVPLTITKNRKSNSSSMNDQSSAPASNMSLEEKVEFLMKEVQYLKGELNKLKR